MNPDSSTHCSPVSEVFVSLLQLPEDTSAQDVAATILAFFCALPSPFLPPQVSRICQTTQPCKASASLLLGEAMSPAEWAIFRHMTGRIKLEIAQVVMRALQEPSARATRKTVMLHDGSCFTMGLSTLRALPGNMALP